MYLNWRSDKYEESMNSSPEIPTIKEDNLSESNSRKKTKGWGHWNSYLKSDEYAKLIPGNDEITDEELSRHNKPDDLWIGLMYEKRVCVFDVTVFAEYHPGGYEIIKSVAGRDATEDFRIAHAYVNPNMIFRFKKGYLVRSAFKSPNTLSPGASMLAPVRRSVSKPIVNSGPMAIQKSVSNSLSTSNPQSVSINKTAPISQATSNRQSISKPQSVSDHGPLSSQRLVSKTQSPARTQPISKPKWDWTESEGVVVLTFTLHRVLEQKLRNVSILCPTKNLFKLRVFLDVEYFFFEIKLQDYLSPILDSMQCDEQGRSISVSFTSTLGQKVSTLGGVIEDKVMSITDAVNKEEFLPCIVTKTRDLNHDCREFGIEWPEWARIGIPLSHHVIVQSVLGGDTVQRPYTPVCEMSPDGYVSESSKEFVLMIKRYPESQLSAYMHTLEENARIMVSLPTGTFASPYWLLSDKPTIAPHSRISSIVLLAAGSGITPMIRLVLASMSTGNIDCHLLFFNRSQRDIIYSDEFQALSDFYNNKFQVSYILSQPDYGWNGLKGRVSQAVCREVLGEQFTDRCYLVCGPLGFNKAAAKACRSLQVPDSQIFEFKG